MANYSPSALAKAQAMLTNKFKTESLKYITPTTFLAVKQLTEIMLPSHKELRTREDRTVEAYAPARTKRSLGSSRDHDHTGDKGDSIALVPQWQTSSDKFSISLKQGDNNVMSYEEMLVIEFENVLRNFAEGLESDAQDFIFNSRSAVGVASSVATYDSGDNVYTIDSVDAQQAVQLAKIVMKENALKGNYIAFCTPRAFATFEYGMNQGQGNSTNLGFQYSNVEFVESIGLESLFAGLSGSYGNGEWIMVPTDALASLDWIPKQNRQGVTTNEQTYGTIINPIDGYTYALHTYAERSDDTLTNGYTQDELRQFEVSIDIAMETAPLTVTGETCIQAFAIGS